MSKTKEHGFVFVLFQGQINIEGWQKPLPPFVQSGLPIVQMLALIKPLLFIHGDILCMG